MKGEGKASIVLQPSQAAARGPRLVAPLRQVAVRPFDELESRHRDMLLLLGWPRSRWLLQVGTVNQRYDPQVLWLDLSSWHLSPGLAFSTSSWDRLDHLRPRSFSRPHSQPRGGALATMVQGVARGPKPVAPLSEVAAPAHQ